MQSRRVVGKMFWLALAAAAVTTAHAATPMVKPESVGLSTARLARVAELMQRNIDAGTFSGSVTLVARYGRVAMFTAQGVMDLESKTPMRTDAVFRIMSMTKPIVAVSILMLAEEGKVRLTDPVGKFIPALQTLKATVPNTEGFMPPSPAFTASAPQPGRIVPAQRPIMIRDLLSHTSGLMSGRVRAPRIPSPSAAGRRWRRPCRASRAFRSISSRARIGPTARSTASTCSRA